MIEKPHMPGMMPQAQALVQEVLVSTHSVPWLALEPPDSNCAHHTAHRHRASIDEHCSGGVDKARVPSTADAACPAAAL